MSVNVFLKEINRIGTIYDGKGLGKRPATKHLSRLQAYCLTVMVYEAKSRDCSKHCHSESTLETQTLVVGPHERLSFIFAHLCQYYWP